MSELIKMLYEKYLVENSIYQLQKSVLIHKVPLSICDAFGIVKKNIPYFIDYGILIALGANVPHSFLNNGFFQVPDKIIDYIEEIQKIILSLLSCDEWTKGKFTKELSFVHNTLHTGYIALENAKFVKDLNYENLLFDLNSRNKLFFLLRKFNCLSKNNELIQINPEKFIRKIRGLQFQVSKFYSDIDTVNSVISVIRESTN